MSKTKYLTITNLLLSITIVSGAFLSSPTTNADNSVIDNVNVTVSVSCTMSGTGMTSHNAEITNGTYQADIGTTTLKAFCNDNEGFAIYAIGFTGDQYTGEDHTKLVGASNSQKITTGTATSGATSNWAMKLNTISSPTPAYPITLDNGYGSYSSVPDAYAKVAHRDSGTDVGSTATGSQLTTTYAAYISKTQAADTYSGKVKYTLVHPKTETPISPQPTTAGYINYYANANTAEGTMGRQSASDGDTTKLFASNFSRDGYGFAGWSDAYDYETNPSANFYGPNEDITVPNGTTDNGLALYAIWIQSEGNLQDSSKVSQLCGTGSGSLTAASYNDEGDSDESTWSITAGLSSVSALTDTRDGQTYAIAKLADGKCWIIENLRLADTHEENGSTVATTLTTSNTNNPLNNGTSVTLKHNYSDSTTYTNLSPTSDVAYDANTAPEGWCTISYQTSCSDQSRLRTDNTANRASYTQSTDMTSPNANIYSYGNLYNWYSSTAGRGIWDMVDNENTVGDICPTGWHLPTGHNDTKLINGDYGILSNSMGGYKKANNIATTMQMSSTTPTGVIMSQRLRHFPNNFIFSGFVHGANHGGRGAYGEYWSSTAGGKWLARHFYFSASTVSPATGASDTYRGNAVRCIVNTQ